VILAAGRFFIAERERLQNGVAHGEPRQHRLRFVADPAGALPVDLMLADARTFATILRSPERFENGVDLQDVKY
jgi:hypothetical protein